MSHYADNYDALHAKLQAVASETHTYPTLRAANRARQAEWDKDNRITLTYRANELAGEVGEACNVAKKIERERLGIAGSRATLDQLAEELADVIICADLVAMAEGIDLDAAVARKFNATSQKVGLTTRLSSPSPVGERVAATPPGEGAIPPGKVLVPRDLAEAVVSVIRTLEHQGFGRVDDWKLTDMRDEMSLCLA